MSHPDTNEILHEHHGWDGRVFDIPTIEDTTKEETINLLRNENAYLRGMIDVYEKFLKDRGYIKEKKKPRPVIADGVEYDSYADYLESRKRGR